MWSYVLLVWYVGTNISEEYVAYVFLCSPGLVRGYKHFGGICCLCGLMFSWPGTWVQTFRRNMLLMFSYVLLTWYVGTNISEEYVAYVFLCSPGLVRGYKHFGGICCFHYEGGSHLCTKHLCPTCLVEGCSQRTLRSTCDWCTCWFSLPVKKVCILLQL
jgi:hypothetical protein